MSLSGVRKIVGRLEGLGVFARFSRAGTDTNYKLDLTRLPPPCHSVAPHHSVSLTVSLSSGDRVTQSPRSSKEVRTNKSEDLTAQMWDAYKERVLGGGRWKLLSRRKSSLRMLYAEQLKTEPEPLKLFACILAAIRADAWAMQKDKDYNLPESVFNSPERRERRANAGRKLLEAGASGDAGGLTNLQHEAAVAGW